MSEERQARGCRKVGEFVKALSANYVMTRFGVKYFQKYLNANGNTSKFFKCNTFIFFKCKYFSKVFQILFQIL